jgi:manganese/zinc/iron transport system substrate-binding protein
MSMNHWMAAAAFFLTAVVGCEKAPSANNDQKKVICTTGMIADMVEHIGGPHVRVETLINGDPHLFKPSASEIANLNRADLVFYSGLHLEGKMGDILERLQERKPTHAVTAGIPQDRILSVGEGHHDPHVWFDVELWSLAAQHVGDTLAQSDPAHAADYQKNTQAYRAELARLHEECKEKLASIPSNQRALVTAHDAFSYFGRAYGLEVRAVQGISTETEAGVKEINELVGFISQRKIKAIFFESTVNKRNVEALIEGCKARGHQVEIGGELFSDAMGEPGTPEGTYVGMVRHNVDTIVKALH